MRLLLNWEGEWLQSRGIPERRRSSASVSQWRFSEAMLLPAEAQYRRLLGTDAHLFGYLNFVNNLPNYLFYCFIALTV